jgi:hypothetical protein
MKGFWKDFVSGDNSVVHSPTVIMAFVGIVLATPIVLFSLDAAYFHIFTLKKGLDGPSVNLLLGLLGAATGGLGTTAYFSKTTMTNISSIGPVVDPSGTPPKAKPAPTS